MSSASSRGTAKRVCSVALGDPTAVFFDNMAKPVECHSAKRAAFIVEACNNYDALRERCERLEAAARAVDTEWTAFWPSGPDGDDHGPRVAMIAEETRVIWRQIRTALRAGDQP